MLDKINRFKEEYSFLSCFYPCTVEYEGIEYPSAEHAFQASKSLDTEVRKRFLGCNTAKDAKYLGKQIELRSDWEEIKISIMKDIVRSKFFQNIADIDLAASLLATGDAYLEEGNTHRDKFWGTVKGEGRNELGKILMEVRKELRKVNEDSESV